ncbi:MAG: DUF3558 family protein [Mycobacteriaceae bacterium]|nr:DUF3558 family protein [Mycobacteriaceae bacterium]
MKLRVKAAGAATVLAICGLAVVGCSSDDGKTGSAPAIPTTVAVQVQMWDPCTMSDDLIRRAGLDPTTKQVQPIPSTRSKICRWKGVDVIVDVLSQPDRTIQDLRQKGDNHDFQDVLVGGRPALMYTSGAQTPSLTMDVAFSLHGGVVDLVVIKRSESRRPAVDSARQISAVLVEGLPQ